MCGRNGRVINLALINWSHMTELLTTPPIEAIWISEPLAIASATPMDIIVAGDITHSMSYNGSALQSGEYCWELTVDYPIQGYRGRVDRTKLFSSSAFRILSTEEWEAYQSLLMMLPLDIEPTELALLKGAVAEAYGLYNEAVTAYKQAQSNPMLHRQAQIYLQRVWTSRAYGILRPNGEMNIQRPVIEFAKKANALMELRING